MADTIYIINASVVNEGLIYKADVTLKDGYIYKITPLAEGERTENIFKATFANVIDASGLYLMPGVIDDQVHFRDPGLEYKGDIYSESKAAIAGGITSFMDMPNTVPQTITQELLEEKYKMASSKSLANYSFYMGATNENIEEVAQTNPVNVCGVKVFLGASTGKMLVDNPKTLDKIFALPNLLIATHCEDEKIIQENILKYKARYGDDVPVEMHPMIRSREACYSSTQETVARAKKYNTRLHVLHVSTKEELALFTNSIPLKDKKITLEACIHHFIFNKDDYKKYGRLIKWNPAIKDASDQEALLEALLDDTIDVVATDHAPHTYEEKQQPYFKSASGGPMVQHSLQAMLEFYHKNRISLSKIVTKMCHAPADCFCIKKRGYIREGYHADVILVDLNAKYKVTCSNILYKCGWSPLTGEEFHSEVTHTFVNGNLVYERGQFYENTKGQRLLFDK